MHTLTVEDVPRKQSATQDPDRVPLGSLRVAGTALEKSLERVVGAAAAGRVVISAFSSSI